MKPTIMFADLQVLFWVLYLISELDEHELNNGYFFDEQLKEAYTYPEINQILYN